MRWLWFPLLSVMLACCVWPAQTDTTSGTGGSSTCPQTSTCQSCAMCALDSPCATLWATCEANSDCEAIDQCYATCGNGDQTCQANCMTDSPNGASDYTAVNNCVYCTECPTICAGMCGS